MGDRPNDRTLRSVSTGWLIAGVVVLVLLTAGLVVFAALTNQRDDESRPEGRTAAIVTLDQPPRKTAST